MMQKANKKIAQNNITYIFAKMYNLLSQYTKEIKDITAFKKRLKDWFRVSPEPL